MSLALTLAIFNYFFCLKSEPSGDSGACDEKTERESVTERDEGGKTEKQKNRKERQGSAEGAKRGNRNRKTGEFESGQDARAIRRTSLESRSYAGLFYMF